jgi:hypothetical protein
MLRLVVPKHFDPSPWILAVSVDRGLRAATSDLVTTGGLARQQSNNRFNSKARFDVNSLRSHKHLKLNRASQLPVLAGGALLWERPLRVLTATGVELPAFSILAQFWLSQAAC